MRIPIFHVNAFASQPLTGNPAAVCLLDSWLDDGLLRKVAAENNLSATAFMLPRGEGYDLRWFTSRCEIRLCGHATLASAHVALNLLRQDRANIHFETRYRGAVTAQKQGDLLALNFPALSPKACTNVPTTLQLVLGLSSPPVEVLEVNDTYIAVYDSPEAVGNVRPNFEALRQFHPFAVAVTAPGSDADFVSRYFAPGYGTPEDPVTGSLHCALTPYWARRFGKPILQARQLSERGGELNCEMAGDRVILKGSAILTMHGELTI